MKTNLVKTTLLVVVISCMLSGCEKETLVNEMEAKKVSIEQIYPNENKNDREIRRDELEKLPIREKDKYVPHKPVQKKMDVMEQLQDK